MLPLILILSCNSETTIHEDSESEKIEQSNNSKSLFSLVLSETHGIKLKNSIQENDKMNYFKFNYMYNGGGVAVGDINNDGLDDLFFTINMGKNRLYLNKGNMQFEDITDEANINVGLDWCTGATMADVNNDGYLDIYVSRSGWFKADNVKANLLLINNKDNTFTEKAAEYGINDPGYSTQASFFDYDNDGDLDLYVINHIREFGTRMDIYKEKEKNPPYNTSDRLYRNDGAKFTDVSDIAGISNYGFSLGIITADFNNDGYQDIYVSNDYESNNLLYLNNKNGTFRESAKSAMKHFSKSSMGVDIADINQDGFEDIFELEMMAEDNKRQKTNMFPMNPDLFWHQIDMGFHYQYMHNCLHLNNGNETFSEVAYLSGIANTDWSWAPLFADFDKDGDKDIFVANGNLRDVIDKDFNNKMKSMFPNAKSQSDVQFSKIADVAPSTKVQNYFFENTGDLKFEKRNNLWNSGPKSHSNGAIYSDLDNDGDLDLVVNNLNDEPHILRNNSNSTNNYIKLNLKGSKKNPDGIGAKIKLTVGDKVQWTSQTLTRGYLSSVSPTLFFGLADKTQIDKIEVWWFDGKKTVLENIAANQTLEVDYSIAKSFDRAPYVAQVKPWISKNKNTSIESYTHKEKSFDDYQEEVLLPHKLSQGGPSIAVSDVNNDNIDDFYTGGAAGQAGTLFMGTKSGSYKKKNQPVFEQDKASEDMGSIFFDADNDGDLDLYVVSGSNEFKENDVKYQDRLYLNDGSGNFLKSSNLPILNTSTSCVTAADFDKDGDLDLFVGGKLIPQSYPEAPGSYILINTDGKFEDETAKIAPQLSKTGMVNSAIWSDYDNDNDLDLIIVGEWMPITVFNNNDGKLKNKTDNAGLTTSNGWWNSITGSDIDNDGDIDYIVGNLGLNSKNKATLNEPFEIFLKDFDNNGRKDIVLGYYNQGINYPVRGLQCSSEQVPQLNKKFSSYESFGEASLAEVYGEDQLDNALHLKSYTMESSILVNGGNGKFQIVSLPSEAQVAPIYGIVAHDINNDGCQDLVLVGNQYPVEVETGRYDALKGLVLKGSCNSSFTPLSVQESGLFVDKDSKSLAIADIQSSNPKILIGSNNDKIDIFTFSSTNSQNNKGKFEYYIGGSYLSQSGASKNK